MNSSQQIKDKHYQNKALHEGLAIASDARMCVSLAPAIKKMLLFALQKPNEALSTNGF